MIYLLSVLIKAADIKKTFSNSDQLEKEVKKTSQQKLARSYKAAIMWLREQQGDERYDEDEYEVERILKKRTRAVSSLW